MVWSIQLLLLVVVWGVWSGGELVARCVVGGGLGEKRSLVCWRAFLTSLLQVLYFSLNSSRVSIWFIVGC